MGRRWAVGGRWVWCEGRPGPKLEAGRCGARRRGAGRRTPTTPHRGGPARTTRTRGPAMRPPPPPPGGPEPAPYQNQNQKGTRPIESSHVPAAWERPRPRRAVAGRPRPPGRSRQARRRRAAAADGGRRLGPAGRPRRLPGPPRPLPGLQVGLDPHAARLARRAPSVLHARLRQPVVHRGGPGRRRVAGDADAALPARADRHLLLDRADLRPDQGRRRQRRPHVRRPHAGLHAQVQDDQGLRRRPRRRPRTPATPGPAPGPPSAPTPSATW